MTWRPSPRRRARGGRANSSLDDAGSAGCRCRCAAWPEQSPYSLLLYTYRTTPARVTKTARAVLAAQLEPRDRTTRTSRGTSSCTSAVSVRPEAELPSRSRLRRLVRGRARDGSRARRATFFLFLASRCLEIRARGHLSRLHRERARRYRRLSSRSRASRFGSVPAARRASPRGAQLLHSNGD